MNFDILSPGPIDEAARAAICAPLDLLRFSQFEVNRPPNVDLGLEALPSGRPVVGRIGVLQLEEYSDDRFVRMDEIAARALAHLQGELSVFTEFDTVMLDRTAEGEVRYRAATDDYRPFLVKSLGPP